MKIFNLVVWAIIALVLLLIAISLYQNFFETNINDEINKGLQKAQHTINIGKLIYVENLFVEKETLFTKENFSNSKRITSFKCTNPNICCPKNEECAKVEWNESYIKFNQQTSTDFYVRCYDNEIINCNVYMGKEPAIGNIKEITQNVEGNNITIKTKIENKGYLSMSNITAELIIEKEINNKWEKTNLEIEKKQLKILQKNNEHEFVWPIIINNLGGYRARIKLYSEDSGISIKTKEFSVKENLSCKIIKNKKDIVEYNEGEYWYREIHYCEGCNYAYECLAKWEKEMPFVNTFEMIDEESVYCKKTSLSGNCG